MTTQQAKYRGIVKGVDTPKPRWAYGEKFSIGGRVFIVPDDAELGNGQFAEYQSEPPMDYLTDFVEVIPKSVGMSTGKFDKNEVMIYQGDMIIAGNDSIQEIVFGEHENLACCSEDSLCLGLAFFFKDKNGYELFAAPYKDCSYEVIGTIKPEIKT